MDVVRILKKMIREVRVYMFRKVDIRQEEGSGCARKK